MLERFQQKTAAGQPMSFMDHLMELRRRLWVSLVAVIVCIVLSLVFYEQLIDFLRVPLDDLNRRYAAQPDYEEILKRFGMPPGSPEIVPLVSISPLGTMMVVMWLGVGAGLVLSSPILVYEIWSFVAPGLKENERRAIRPILLGGLVFFLLGCALAYYMLFPVTLDFAVWLDLRLRFRIFYTVDSYISMVINMMAIAGLICEIPLVIAGLARLGLVHVSHLTKYWRFCVLAAFILGSIFSPGTDMISMLLFSALLLSIYLVSVLFAFMFYRGEKPR